MTDDASRTQPGRLATAGRRPLRRGPAAPSDGPRRRSRPWRTEREALFREHAQSPVPADGARGVPGAALPDRPGAAVRGRGRARRAASPATEALTRVGAAVAVLRGAAPAAAGERRRARWPSGGSGVVDVPFPAGERRLGAVLDGGLRRRPVPAVPRRDERPRDLWRRPLPARRREERRPRRRRRRGAPCGSTSTSPTSRRAPSTRAGPVRSRRRRTGWTSRSAPVNGSPDRRPARLGATVRIGRPDPGLSAAPARPPRRREDGAHARPAVRTRLSCAATRQGVSCASSRPSPIRRTPHLVARPAVHPHARGTGPERPPDRAGDRLVPRRRRPTS